MSNEKKQRKPNYTLEFKLDADKLVIKQAADHLGVSLSAIRRWVLGYQAYTNLTLSLNLLFRYHCTHK